MAKMENSVINEGHVSASSVTVDDNNNNDNNNNKTNLRPVSTLKPSNGKYQLRPRSLQARRFCDSDWSFNDTIRDKPRPQPLSRYRRKTANARERYRMRQINTAFESLRGVLPSWVCSRRAASDLTKITTLKLASAYIRALQDILDGNTSEDSCPWVFSAILKDSSSTEDNQTNPSTTTNMVTEDVKSPSIIASQATTEADLVSLLCSTADSSSLDDSFDSFSQLSPIGDTDPVTLLLLGSDSSSSRCWGEGPQVSLVT